MGDCLVLKKQKPEKKLSNNKRVAKKKEKKTKQCLNNFGKVVIKATMIASKKLQFLFGKIYGRQENCYSQNAKK